MGELSLEICMSWTDYDVASCALGSRREIEESSVPPRGVGIRTRVSFASSLVVVVPS